MLGRKGKKTKQTSVPPGVAIVCPFCGVNITLPRSWRERVTICPLCNEKMDLPRLILDQLAELRRMAAEAETEQGQTPPKTARKIAYAPPAPEEAQPIMLKQQHEGPNLNLTGLGKPPEPTQPPSSPEKAKAEPVKAKPAEAARNADPRPASPKPKPPSAEKPVTDNNETVRPEKLETKSTSDKQDIHMHFGAEYEATKSRPRIQKPGLSPQIVLPPQPKPPQPKPSEIELSAHELAELADALESATEIAIPTNAGPEAAEPKPPAASHEPTAPSPKPPSSEKAGREMPRSQPPIQKKPVNNIPRAAPKPAATAKPAPSPAAVPPQTGSGGRAEKAPPPEFADAELMEEITPAGERRLIPPSTASKDIFQLDGEKDADGISISEYEYMVYEESSRWKKAIIIAVIIIGLIAAAYVGAGLIMGRSESAPAVVPDESEDAVEMLRGHTGQ